VSRIYDISVPIRSGGLVYPGNPEIDISLQQAVAKGAGANVSAIRFGSHTGTHADAARHFFDNGQTVDKIPLERLIGPAILLSFADDVRSVGSAELRAHDIKGQTRILLRTRNSAFLSQKEFVKDYTSPPMERSIWWTRAWSSLESTTSRSSSSTPDTILPTVRCSSAQS
jgi:arylformamidase